jgi:hypothetical protein
LTLIWNQLLAVQAIPERFTRLPLILRTILFGPTCHSGLLHPVLPNNNSKKMRLLENVGLAKHQNSSSNSFPLSIGALSLVNPAVNIVGNTVSATQASIHLISTAARVAVKVRPFLEEATLPRNFSRPNEVPFAVQPTLAVLNSFLTLLEHLSNLYVTKQLADVSGKWTLISLLHLLQVNLFTIADARLQLDIPSSKHFCFLIINFR